MVHKIFETAIIIDDENEKKMTMMTIIKCYE